MQIGSRQPGNPAAGSRVVIYYNANTIPLRNYADTDYTQIILSFTEPKSGTIPGQPVTLVLDGNLTSTVMSQIPTVQQAGKAVLLSLGGGACSNSDWQAMSEDLDNVVSQLVGYVQQYGLDGIDIDFEDSGAFQAGATFDGTQFLIGLTRKLYGALPSGKKIISHAPQPPYFYSGWDYAYKTIMQECGDAIAWLNVQYYNNPDFQDPSYITGPSQGAVQGIMAIGVPAEKVVVGKPVGPNDAGSGYLPPDDIVHRIIQPLQQEIGSFGGMMGWQASSDPSGSWAAAMAGALNPPTS
ncbi:glycosyl hydrolase family 18 protein [Oleisolibacter albus]|uniref:glycosyl hydrolase family 18 protein n=1 Tax=Oleisolibacter albus TaxID=2171757 RepID=UPI000DF2B994|nr:glycosyl hydrolase family 18 protein [Oleisolibacter albus]